MGRRALIYNGTYSLLQGWLQTASTKILPLVAHDTRPGLEACLKALHPQDTLVVWKLDRPGWNLRPLVTPVETLHQREMGLKVVTGQGAQIDTTTATAAWCLGFRSSVAER